MSGYIKKLDFKIFTSFNKRYLSVDYFRRGEHNHYTLVNPPYWVKDDKSVRKFINQ